MIFVGFLSVGINIIDKLLFLYLFFEKISTVMACGAVDAIAELLVFSLPLQVAETKQKHDETNG